MNKKGVYQKFCKLYLWANLRNAHLERTFFEETNLEGANFQGAYLENAYFEGDYLKGVKNLTIDQLSNVKTLHNAQLDEKCLYY